jgi:hypothetical protein
MTTPSGRPLVDAALLAEIDALPDEALVEARGGRFCIALPKPSYVADPDFSHAGTTLAATAAVIRADLRGVGKYAPHFDSYAVEYRLLPHWRLRVGKPRCTTCGGPLRATSEPTIWLHDGRDPFYAGRQVDHDAEPQGPSY